MENKIAVFNNNNIRRIWFEEDWWFSVIDVIQVLIDQTDNYKARKYWNKLSQRLREEGSEAVTNCHQLKLITGDGKMRLTDCANTEGLFRIIQSIPSPKVEPFKRWLAKVGKERIDEIENPELAQERMKQLYEQKGYPADWIDKRLRGMAIRQDLTDEWKARGLKEEKDFAILTAEISRATFDMTPSEYMEFKNLPSKSKVNLRDHMTDLELIFTMLGERVTTKISEKEKPQEMSEHKDIAKRGGNVAGNAREQTEKEIGEPIVSKDNFLQIKENSKNKSSDKPLLQI